MKTYYKEIRRRGTFCNQYIEGRVAVFVYILRRNCFLIQFIVGKIEEMIKQMGRRGRRRKQIEVDL